MFKNTNLGVELPWPLKTSLGKLKLRTSLFAWMFITHTINNKPQNVTWQKKFYTGKDTLCLSFFLNKEKECLSYYEEIAQQFALGSDRDLLNLA